MKNKTGYLKNLTAIMATLIVTTSFVWQEKPNIEWVSVPAGTFIMGSPGKPVGSFAPNAWGLYDMHGNV